MSKTFKDLGLNQALLQTLAQKGYEHPTPIQAQAIPEILSGRDLMGIAQTGTGKTAAFALPILHRLAADKKPVAKRTCRALILSPTRELASQIAESFRTYGKGLGLSVAIVYGGVGYGPQERSLLAGVDILVATPGRLMDHMEQKTIGLSATEILVLDEADQMLDMGFVKPIRLIVSRMAKVRQNLFFSATMSGEIAALASEILQNPAKIQVTPGAPTAERVEQRVVFVEQNRKRVLLKQMFTDPTFTRTLVFTKTKHGAERLSDYLEAGGIKAAAIHGNKSQSQRERALAAFKAGRVRALVATDVAARGIDVDGVTHVINYELPQVAEAYVHRIGRTARAGASGIAVSFCADDERKLLRDIQRLTRQNIPVQDRRGDRELTAFDNARAAEPDLRVERPAREAGHLRGRDSSEGAGRGSYASERPSPSRPAHPGAARPTRVDEERARGPRKRFSQGSRPRTSASY